MLISELVKKIREPWKASVLQKIGKSESGRRYLAEELDRFFDMLVQSVESGDPDWLKPVLIDWSASRTETDISDEEITLSPVLNVLMDELIAAARTSLTPDETVALMESLVPVFYYSYEQVARHETLVRLGYVSAKLEKVQSDLERLDRSKSDFIAVAAHELRTPLTLIEGYTAMLRDQTSGKEDGEGIAVLLRGIDNGIERLAEIINDMIDVSLIDTQMLSLNFQPTWINRLLNVLQHELEDQVEERKIEVEINDFPGAGEMIFADPERIHQVLRNVLNNAIKYTPDGGKVVVDGRLLPGFVEVTVTDKGIGVDPDDQDRIFEKFGGLGDVSLHSSGKTKFKGGGPGLGLPIAKGILEAHGGTIWVESEGRDEEKLPGSIFHILLPLRKEPPDEQMSKLFGIRRINEDELDRGL